MDEGGIFLGQRDTIPSWGSVKLDTP